MINRDLGGPLSTGHAGGKRDSCLIHRPPFLCFYYNPAADVDHSYVPDDRPK
jgi:hypothetical protein